MMSKDFDLPDFDAPARPYRPAPQPAQPAPTPPPTAEGAEPTEQPSPPNPAPGGLLSAINELKAKLHAPGPSRNLGDWYPR